MRSKKAKILRRIAWTTRRNPCNKQLSYRQLKREYPKGVTTGPYAYYPREGRNTKKLLYGPF
jgi:hypothetical protein